MQKDDTKQILLKFAAAETAEEIDTILKDEFFSKVKWMPYDNNRHNFGQINNQQRQTKSNKRSR